MRFETEQSFTRQGCDIGKHRRQTTNDPASSKDCPEAGR
jgi:hypothetical protein